MTTQTQEVADRDRRQLLGTAMMGIGAADTANLLPS
jgi:hypothetical protein